MKDRADTADFYDLEPLFSAEEKLTRDTVREFVREQVKPIIEACYQRAAFPAHLIPEIARLGLFGANLKGYGCAGIGDVAYGLAMQELERGDSGLRSCVSVQGALVMYPIHTFGSEEQKGAWLPRLARGEAIGCFGLTEPDHGSDPASMKTRARRSGNDYVLTGTKTWITNGTISDVSLIWAKDEEGVIRGFLVETDRQGFQARDIQGKLSFRASVTSEIVLNECRVPAANMLPGAEGLKSALMCLSQARYGIAWGVLGAALDCYETALSYAKTRTVFGRPIAARQLVQQKLVWMLAEITKGQLLAYRLGRLKEEGRATFAQISLAKMNNVAFALECARLARDILAASGILGEYPVMRHLCNLETVKTYEGTHDIHTLILGQQITGYDAFR